MKKEELTEIGLTEEQADKVIVMNGKSIESLKKTNKELSDSNEDLKGRLKTAEDTLTGFGELKPEEVTNQIQSYKDRAEKAEREAAEKITHRDQRDWLNTQFDEYGVISPYARKQLASEIMSKDGLPWKDNAFLGFDDYMKAAKEKDNSLYLSEEEKENQKAKEHQQDKKKFFTGPTGKNKQEESTSDKGPLRFF